MSRFIQVHLARKYKQFNRHRVNVSLGIHSCHKIIHLFFSQLRQLASFKSHLERQRQVKVVPLAPHDERLLLLLVGSVGLDLGLQEEGSVRLGPNDQADPLVDSSDD